MVMKRKLVIFIRGKYFLITFKSIAPCGMNCAICLAQQRDRNKCLGCREMSESKSSQCRKCIKMPGETIEENKMPFCSDKCEKFPCTRLKNLDKRCKNKYKISILDNLDNIKKFGITKFVKSEHNSCKLSNCEELLCVHRDSCLNCGEKR